VQKTRGALFELRDCISTLSFEKLESLGEAFLDLSTLNDLQTKFDGLN
jgi:dsRNA-specific ribonuclease